MISLFEFISTNQIFWVKFRSFALRKEAGRSCCISNVTRIQTRIMDPTASIVRVESKNVRESIRFIFEDIPTIFCSLDSRNDAYQCYRWPSNKKRFFWMVKKPFRVLKHVNLKIRDNKQYQTWKMRTSERDKDVEKPGWWKSCWVDHGDQFPRFLCRALFWPWCGFTTRRAGFDLVHRPNLVKVKKHSHRLSCFGKKHWHLVNEPTKYMVSDFVLVKEIASSLDLKSTISEARVP